MLNRNLDSCQVYVSEKAICESEFLSFPGASNSSMASWQIFGPSNIAILLLITINMLERTFCKLRYRNIFLFTAGLASLYICKPSRAGHAWDNLGCSPGHHPWEDLWRSRSQDPLFRVPASYATGETMSSQWGVHKPRPVSRFSCLILLWIIL